MIENKPHDIKMIVISVTNLAKTSMMADKSLADQAAMMNVGR